MQRDQLGPVSSPATHPMATVKVWGRTSGGASQSLDSPSYGVSSITDAGVGLLDVTFMTPWGTAYDFSVAMTIQQAESTICAFTLASTASGTAIRLIMSTSGGGAGDPAGGYHFAVIG